ncbi:MAG: hypothetical protein A3G34_13785 [Candidatus Lindowbacteria bacterium RIFCSPLOWO2_12_FULL_62_27]|nr:MAG: hypothetical protein A3I06_12510 [Candidatus Lindowbacteria bacterium RIFCSPLOWO2_02_FULL_62_12]OGH62648.1 MAG: hypothetical protein A3G34_13785 [Candidatus Lindowbacteria bacterium RIFCSPLOWO2_12_FULL_62_27]
MSRPVRNGFTLIELLVAFAFVSLATLSLLEVVRHSLRMLNSAQDHAIAAQAALAPTLGLRDIGAWARELKSEQVELGPIRFRSTLLEVTPAGRTTGVQIHVYD